MLADGFVQDIRAVCKQRPMIVDMVTHPEIDLLVLVCEDRLDPGLRIDQIQEKSIAIIPSDARLERAVVIENLRVLGIAKPRNANAVMMPLFDWIWASELRNVALTLAPRPKSNTYWPAISSRARSRSWRLPALAQ